MTRIHITENGKAAPCNASLRECPRGVSNHFDSMKEAVVEMRKRELAAETAQAEPTQMGNEAQQVLGSERGLLFTEQDAMEALEAREVTQGDLARYLSANGHDFLVDAVRARLRADDADGWRDWADADQMTTEDKHHIALREVAVDIDRWVDETDGHLIISPLIEQPIPAVGDPATLARKKAASLEKNSEWLGGNGDGAEDTAIIEEYKQEHASTIKQYSHPRQGWTVGVRLSSSGAPVLTKEYNEGGFYNLQPARGQVPGQWTHHEAELMDARIKREQEKAAKAAVAKQDNRDPRHRYGATKVKQQEDSTGGGQSPKELDPAMIEALKLKYLKVKKQPFEESGLSIPELLQMAQRGELG